MWEELIGRLTSIPQNNANEQLQGTSSRSGPLEQSVMSGKAFVWGSGSERPVFDRRQTCRRTRRSWMWVLGSEKYVNIRWGARADQLWERSSAAVTERTCKVRLLAEEHEDSLDPGIHYSNQSSGPARRDSWDQGGCINSVSDSHVRHG